MFTIFFWIVLVIMIFFFYKAQLKRCEKLLESGEPELIIHGLGAAVNRACNLALQLKGNHCGTLELDINTATTDLIGE